MTKILVVDDDEEATNMLYKILSTEGYEPIIVNDSSKAVQFARSLLPDLILLDLMMPEPDGFKICRLLRADEKFAETPIIILTALDDSDSRFVAFGAGATDYLTKPYNINDLVERVKALTE